MKYSNSIILLLFILLIACGKSTESQGDVEFDSKPIESEDPSIFYELRTYYAGEGKLPNLLTRFRDHTTKLFEKHGMTNIAYWVPTDNVENILVYLMAYPSREARDKSWESFMADEEWKRVWEASKVDGPLVDSVASVYMTLTDFSAVPEVEDIGDRVFEMRTYYTHEEKLPELHARFRDHTMKLFEKHGMTNIAYFQLEEDMFGASNTLVYFLSHKDGETASASWQGFRDDPDWQTAYQTSRENGPLVDSLESVYMVPTDFSPLK